MKKQNHNSTNVALTSKFRHVSGGGTRSGHGRRYYKDPCDLADLRIWKAADFFGGPELLLAFWQIVSGHFTLF